MKVLLFGGSGMIGQGALLECLARTEVTQVISVGRTPVPQQHAKLVHLQRSDLFDWSDAKATLSDVGAVLFCLGVSSSGMTEADYARVSRDLPVAVGRAVAEHSPGSTFCFISGAGTDAKSSTMWARVKGEAENQLLALNLKTYCFRPGYIQPLDGIESKTPSYRRMYRFTSVLYPLIKGLPKYVTSTRELGRALVNAAVKGAPKQVLESSDLNQLARE